MNRKMVYGVMICFLFLGGLCGCEPVNQIHPTPLSGNFPWVNRWLERSACDPPCWEGIIPGETTIYQISKTTVNPENELTIYGPYLSQNVYAINWLYPYQDKYDYGVSMYTVSEDDMTIDEIRFDFEGSGKVLTVGEITKNLGDPEQVGVYTDGEVIHCVGALLYSEKSVYIQLGAQIKGDSYKLNENTGISRAFYLSKTNWDETINELFNYNLIQPWKGYGKYHCQN
jgi:hypothetical protein